MMRHIKQNFLPSNTVSLQVIIYVSCCCHIISLTGFRTLKYNFKLASANVYLSCHYDVVIYVSIMSMRELAIKLLTLT